MIAYTVVYDATGNWTAFPDGEVPSATLYQHATGEPIRSASPEELTASIEASKTDGGIGAIVVDGVTCYVQE